jgi:hypothetical protein
MSKIGIYDKYLCTEELNCRIKLSSLYGPSRARACSARIRASVMRTFSPFRAGWLHGQYCCPPFPLQSCLLSHKYFAPAAQCLVLDFDMPGLGNETPGSNIWYCIRWTGGTGCVIGGKLTGVVARFIKPWVCDGIYWVKHPRLLCVGSFPSKCV